MGSPVSVCRTHSRGYSARGHTLHSLPVGFRSPASSCGGWGGSCCYGVARHRQPYWTMFQVSWVAPHCSSRQGGHRAPTRGSRLNRKAPKAPPGWQMCLKVELPGTSAPATTCLLIPAWEGKRPRRPARARRRLASDSPDVGKPLLSWSDSSHLFSS